MKRSRRRPSLRVTTGGQGVVSHAGARLLCELADELGLTAGLSAAMAPTKQRRRGHDRGEVLADLAVAIADGATTITDLRVLANQPSLFGEVASTATAWRTLQAVDDAAMARIATARAEARRQAWEAGMDPGFYVVDIDGTLVNAHSDKEGAGPTYKHGFGFYPLMAYLDATGEPLAGVLRPGNAGSGTADDHVTVLDAALAQLPVEPHRTEVIVRTDTAGCSHGLLDACRERGARFVVGHSLTAELAMVAMSVPETAWRPAVSADGTDEREHAQVAELTGLADLSGWPGGTRMIARREEPHPGAQLTFTDIDGHRYQLFLTDHPSPDIAFLEGVYRGRGRCECAIRDAKDTGLANFPSASFAINQAWLVAVLIAGDLLAWMKGGLPPRRAGAGRAQAPALHTAARRRRARALRTTDHTARRAGLAVGRRARRRVRPAALLVSHRLTPPPARPLPRPPSRNTPSRPARPIHTPDRAGRRCHPPAPHRRSPHPQSYTRPRQPPRDPHQTLTERFGLTPERLHPSQTRIRCHADPAVRAT